MENGVKNLGVQPTHLMHGAEYDEMMEMIDTYRDKFESVAVAEPLLGAVSYTHLCTRSQSCICFSDLYGFVHCMLIIK